MNNSLLIQAINLAKTGNKNGAYKILVEIIKEDPQNEIAWFWMAACTLDVERKRFFLSKVLEINPDNQKASELFEQLTEIPLPDLKDVIPTQQEQSISSSNFCPRCNNNHVVQQLETTNYSNLAIFLGVLAFVVTFFIIASISTNIKYKFLSLR